MGIFLSYRRADSQDVVGRIYDRLITHFSIESVFRDLDSLPIGKPFPEAVDEALLNASVALIVIGPRWTSITNESGQRRLSNPSDLVRLEVEKALASNIPVIPVFVSNAVVPREIELPQTLRPLIYRNGVNVRPDPDFHRDMDRLIGKLSQLINSPTLPNQNTARIILQTAEKEWKRHGLLIDSARLDLLASEKVRIDPNQLDFVFDSLFAAIGPDLLNLDSIFNDTQGMEEEHLSFPITLKLARLFSWLSSQGFTEKVRDGYGSIEREYGFGDQIVQNIKRQILSIT